LQATQAPPWQAGVGALQAALVPFVLFCASAQTTHWCVAVSQAGVEPLQSAAVLQPKQVPMAVQIGCVTGQSAPVAHCPQKAPLGLAWHFWPLGQSALLLVGLQPATQAPEGLQMRPPEHCASLAHGLQVCEVVSQCGAVAVAQSSLVWQPWMAAQQPLLQALCAGHCESVEQLAWPTSQPRGPLLPDEPEQPKSPSAKQTASAASRWATFIDPPGCGARGFSFNTGRKSTGRMTAGPRPARARAIPGDGRVSDTRRTSCQPLSPAIHDRPTGA
jgi:hypothetical protein